MMEGIALLALVLALVALLVAWLGARRRAARWRSLVAEGYEGLRAAQVAAERYRSQRDGARKALDEAVERLRGLSHPPPSAAGGTPVLDRLVAENEEGRRALSRPRTGGGSTALPGREPGSIPGRAGGYPAAPFVVPVVDGSPTVSDCGSTSGGDC